jgi:ABC-type transport system involved in cytochrome bd biosynthesis fused ATPase/permease subunit
MEATTMSRDRETRSEQGTQALSRNSAASLFGSERGSDVPDKTVGVITHDDPIFACRSVDVFYADKQAIFGVDLDIGRNQVISMIGPSGPGASSWMDRISSIRRSMLCLSVREWAWSSRNPIRFRSPSTKT